MSKADVKEAKRIIIQIFLVIAISITCFVSLIAYPSIQKSLFSEDSNLIFVNNTSEGIYTVIILGLIPFSLTFFIGYILLWQHSTTFKKIITYKTLLFSILLMGIGFYYQLHHYQFIDKQGIHIKKDIFSNVKDYKFSDIKNVYVYIKNDEGKHSDRLYIKYEMNLSDGSIIDLKYSSEFWEKIVDIDILLTSQGVKVSRENIDHLTYIRLLIKYDNRNWEIIPRAIEKIFAYTPEYKRKLYNY